VERKKLETILDEVAEKWFVGIDGPTKQAKKTQNIARGKEKAHGYPQLMELKKGSYSCPHCGVITGSSSKINLKTNTQTWECGCKRPFFRL